jgi:hypothetical protein
VVVTGCASADCDMAMAPIVVAAKAATIAAAMAARRDRGRIISLRR